MESMIIQALVQKLQVQPLGLGWSWSSVASFLHWGFWAGLVIGLLGTLVLFLIKPRQVT